MTNYTTPAFPPPAGQVSNFINPSTSQGPKITSSIIISLVLALVFVFARLWTRVVVIKRYGLDDYFLLAAVVTALFFQAACLYSVKLGLGRNIWDVPIELYASCLEWFFVTEMFYYVAIMFCKLSIVAFLNRFTTKVRESHIIWGFLFFIAAYNIVSIFVLLFACTPVSKLWDPAVTWGTCTDTDWVYPTNAVLNIITDLIILILPIPMLIKLKLPIGQKLSLGVIFLSGGFVIVVTVIRLLTLNEIGASGLNISMGFTMPSIWSVIEVNICLILASVPAMKPFVQRYFSFFGAWKSAITRSKTGENGVMELSNDPYQSKSTHEWGRTRGVNTSAIAGGSSIDNMERSESMEKIVNYQVQDVSPGLPGIMVNTQVDVIHEDEHFEV